MKLEFVKMSGEGNDFIVVDNLDSSLDTVLTPKLVRTLCRRGLSVGADGLLEITSDSELPYRMRYSNSDGLPADMCGNGARCLAVYACARGIVQPGEPFRFRSDAGTHRALVTEADSARIWITEPVVHFLDRPVEIASNPLRVSFVDTGVPHAVVFRKGPGEPCFTAAAPQLRRHPLFGEAGANVDFLNEAEDGILRMRTWERGVEAETLACGTGAVACAVCAHRLAGAALPVTLLARSGGMLTVGHDDDGWWLQGRAWTVYRGIIPDLPLQSLTESP